MNTRFILIAILPFAVCNQSDADSHNPECTVTESTLSITSGKSPLYSGKDTGEIFDPDDFDRTISIVFTDDGVNVAGDINKTVTIDCNHVTVDNKSEEMVIYRFSGKAMDGSVRVYSNKRQAMVLDNLYLTNSTGAAINIQSKKKCHVLIEGTNVLTDGTCYSATPAGEDEKAAFFSEGQLLFGGSGSLTVNAYGKSGIISDDYVQFTDSATINVVSTAGHGIRGKKAVLISGGSIGVMVSADMKKGIASDSLVSINGGSTIINVTGSAAYDEEGQEYKGTAGIKADCRFEMNGGTLSITNWGTGGKGISGDNTACFNGGVVRVNAIGSNYGSRGGGPMGPPQSRSSNSVSAKGIKFDGNLFFNGGTVIVNCAAHEGIESKGNITVTDGVVYSYSAADDAMNSAGTFTIQGGYVCGYAVRNDGLDANGNFYIKGGMVYAIGSTQPEVAIDANTEGGYKLYVMGGTLIAIGGLESGASLSQNCYQASSWTRNTLYSLKVGNDVIAFRTPSSGGTPLVVSGASAPILMTGVAATDGTAIMEGMIITDASVSGGSQVSLSSYTGGNGGGFGPGGGGPGGPGGRPW